MTINESIGGTTGGAATGGALGGPIGAVIGGGMGLMTGLLGTGATNKANKEIAQMNIDLQRETNAKNEALMRESWQRDDTAVQRRTRDLVSAGMSPLLAAGSAAGNSPIVSYKAPESHQVIQQSDLAGALSGIYQGIMTQQSMMDMVLKQQQMQINQSQFNLNEKAGLADATLKDVQAAIGVREQIKKEMEYKGIELDNELKRVGLKYADQSKLLQYMQELLNYDVSEYNYRMSNRYGLRTNETGNTITKTAQQLDHAISNIAKELFGK